MLSDVDEAQQVYAGAHHSVEEWLDERKRLLVQYCQLAGLPPFDNRADCLPDYRNIRDFCEILVDYVSAGHFEVYEKLAGPDVNLQGDSANLQQKIYPKISDNTEAALAFNDAYAEVSEDSELANFDAQLSHLGQMLEERFELEDKLLDALQYQQEKDD